MNVHHHNPEETEEAKKLVGSLSELKRRGQILAAVNGLGWTLFGVASLVLIFVAVVGWFGGDGLRAAGWTALGLGSALLASLTLIRPLLRLGREGGVARRIGQAFPNLASDVITADQLATHGVNHSFSNELVAIHLKTVTQTLATIPKHRIFPLAPLMGPAVALLSVLLFGATLKRMYSSTAKTGLASLLSDAKPPVIETRQISAKAPLVGDLEVTLKYPKYLDRPERKLDGISGGVAAPVGTTVIVEGKSLIQDADRGLVNLPGGGTSRLSINSQSRVYGRFVVRTAGEFSLALGNQSVLLEGPKRALEVEVDGPPTIRLLRPTKRVEVAEDGEVLLEMEAEDDHGIGHIDLVLRTADGLERRKTIIHLADQVRRVKTQYRWAPESVRVADDVDLHLELEAYDNDLITGPKRGHSAPISVRVLTPASRHKNAMATQNEVLAALVDLLAKRLGLTVPNKRKQKEILNRFTELSRETEDVLGKLARLIHALNLDGMSPKKVADTYVQIRQDISNQIFAESNLHRPKVGDFRKRLTADKLIIRTIEDSIIRVDDLIIEGQLSRVVQTGNSLDTQRGELTDLLLRYSASRGEAARRALLQGIGKMEEVLHRLEQEVKNIRSKVGDTFINPSANIHLDLMGSLDKLRALIAEGDLAEAGTLVKNLENDLSRLMAALEGGLLSFRTERFGEDDRFVGELLDKVLALESDQLQLRRETTAITRRVQERLVEFMRGRIDALVKKQLVRSRHMSKTLKDIESPKKERGRLRLVRARILSEELRLALGQGDLDEARQIAEEMQRIGGEWKRDQAATNRVEFSEVGRKAGQIKEEIEGAYPKPAQLLNDRDRRLTKNYTKRQRGLVVQAKRLKSWAGRQKSAMRFLSHRAGGALSSVSSHMNEAGTALDEKRVHFATSKQTTALDELARLREDLKRGNQVAPLKSRPLVLHGRVELPDPDDYQVPPEFRDEILQAMENELPGMYRSAIKKYYETLVQ